MPEQNEQSWSNSSLETLQKCGEMYRRRYIERERTLPAPRMIQGTSVHRAAKHAHMAQLRAAEGALDYRSRQMRSKLAVPSVEEAQDVAADAFEKEWSNGVMLDSEERAEGEDKVRGATKDFSVDMAGFHAVAVAPAVMPVGVERQITVRPRDSDIKIVGVIDLIDEIETGIVDGVVTTDEIIRDFKTGDKAPSKSAADDSQQLDMYALLRTAEVGKPPREMALDYLIRTPARRDKKHVVLKTTRDMDDVRAIVNRINTATEAVKRGVFLPTSPSNWWCSRRWCAYYTTCKYVRMTERPTT